MYRTTGNYQLHRQVCGQLIVWAVGAGTDIYLGAQDRGALALVAVNELLCRQATPLPYKRVREPRKRIKESVSYLFFTTHERSHRRGDSRTLDVDDTVIVSLVGNLYGTRRRTTASIDKAWR